MEQQIHTDVFIAGAGASGIAAAVAAAELGMHVCLAEKNSFAGGRATASAVGTICGLYLRSQTDLPKFVMQGFPKEFATHLMAVNMQPPQKFSEGLWFLPCLPNDFEQVAKQYLNHEKMNAQFNTKIMSAEYSQQKILSLRCEQNGKSIKIFAKQFIDCSGQAVLCKAFNHNIVEDLNYQAAAIVFSIKDFSIDDEYRLNFVLMKHIMQQIVAKKIPEYFNLLSVVPASLKNNSMLFKFGLPWQVNDSENIGDGLQNRAKHLVDEAVGFLTENIPGFEKSKLDWIAKEVGIRTGIRAKGKTMLTNHDVLNCIKHNDGICKGAWPIEYWQTGNKKVNMTYFTENDFYTIPAGCLISNEMENLFFAGKIISAEEKAIASARVIGTCFGTGYAAGVLASYKIKNLNQADAIDLIKNKMLQ